MWVENRGAIQLPAGTSVAFYDGPPAGRTAFAVGATSVTLAPGAAELVVAAWPNPPMTSATIYVRVDDDGRGQGAHNECDETPASNEVQVPNLSCP